ncbi:MAG: glycosyltransferase family 2 protein, partial [Lachnospiraceae bacterium]|nr:glycosyltransferase family 2 protein [Lachnospiraceae bacterium]
MKEKISVIIPVYNVEAYVGKCIKSVCRQTYEELEIILIDDGSTDSSGKICDEWAENDNRIVVLHQENRGLSGARNAGLEKATGEYITFLDSDDYIAPMTYEEMLRAGKQFQADVTIVSFQKVYHSDEETVTGDGSVVCVTGREAAAKLYASKEEYLFTVVAW